MIWKTSIKETTGSWICSRSKLTGPWPLLIRSKLNQHNRSFNIFPQQERRSNGATDKSGLRERVLICRSVLRFWQKLTLLTFCIDLLHFQRSNLHRGPPQGEAQSLGGLYLLPTGSDGEPSFGKTCLPLACSPEKCASKQRKRKTKEGRENPRAPLLRRKFSNSALAHVWVSN